MLSATGRSTLRIFGELGDFTRFTARGYTSAIGSRRLGRRLARAVYEQGVRCLPVILIVGTFTGLVLGLQGYHTLKGFGSASLLGPLVANSLIRELAPVLAALMIVGQAGSALTAELGIQRNSEQIDALETMGIDPHGFLVAPRLLAAAKPAAVVISAGSNDIHGGADAEAVLAAWRDVVAAIRRDHPTVPILVMGILPAKSRWEERETQTTANGLIQAAIAAAGGVIDGGPVEYLDVWGDFVGPDGAPDPEAFLDDDLHPSAIGNARRAARMRPVLDRLIGE
jgi:lysophospholipase L1-like esterase